MKRSRLFSQRRRFDTTMDRLQEQAGESIGAVRDHAAMAAHEARRGMEQGKKKLRALERRAIRSFRQRDATSYLLMGGAMLIGMIATGFLLTALKGRRHHW